MSRIYKIEQLTSGSIKITKNSIFYAQILSSSSLFASGNNTILIKDATEKVFEFNINDLYSILDNLGTETLITASFSVDEVYAVLEPFFFTSGGGGGTDKFVSVGEVVTISSVEYLQLTYNDASGIVPGTGATPINGIILPYPNLQASVFVNGLSGNDSTGQRLNIGLPFQSIEAAVVVAQPGDTIYISSFTYEVTVANDAGGTLTWVKNLIKLVYGMGSLINLNAGTTSQPFFDGGSEIKVEILGYPILEDNRTVASGYDGLKLCSHSGSRYKLQLGNHTANVGWHLHAGDYVKIDYNGIVNINEGTCLRSSLIGASTTLQNVYIENVNINHTNADGYCIRMSDSGLLKKNINISFNYNPTNVSPSTTIHIIDLNNFNNFNIKINCINTTTNALGLSGLLRTRGNFINGILDLNINHNGGEFIDTGLTTLENVKLFLGGLYLNTPASGVQNRWENSVSVSGTKDIIFYFNLETDCNILASHPRKVILTGIIKMRDPNVSGIDYVLFFDSTPIGATVSKLRNLIIDCNVTTQIPFVLGGNSSPGNQLVLIDNVKSNSSTGVVKSTYATMEFESIENSPSISF